MFWVFQGQHLERNDNTNILLSQFTHPLSKFIYPLFPFCNSLSRFQKPLSRFVISVSWLQIMRCIFVNSPCMLAIIISTKQCLILGFYQKIGRSKKNEKKTKNKKPIEISPLKTENCLWGGETKLPSGMTKLCPSGRKHDIFQISGKNRQN